MSSKSPSKKSKISTTVVIALIGLAGTVITALLTSPVLIELIKNSGATEMPNTPIAGPTSSNQTQVFNEDFDDNSASGFAFRSGDWEIAREKGNPALKFTATGDQIPAAVADFGPAELKDGVIEFRLYFVELQGMYLDFREQSDGSRYTLAFSPNDSVVVWAANIFDGSNWNFSPVSPAASQPYTFQTNQWYVIRVEMRGVQVTVTTDGNRVISASDDRFTSGNLRFALQSGAIILLDDVRIWAYE